MKNLFYTFLLIFPIISIFGQSAEKIILNKKDTTDYYLQLKPKGEIKGLMILLPGFASDPNEVFIETNLPQLAAEKGILTITFFYGQKLFIDSETEKLIDKIVAFVLKKHTISKNKVTIGGFSAGGTLAVHYAEKCFENPHKPIQPKAVFAIDSPLDLKHIYYEFKREIEKNCPVSSIGVKEAEFILPILEKDLAGTPESASQNYISNSGFSRGQKNGGNAQFLNKTPIRFYTEPDYNWQMTQRCRDVYDMNIFDGSGFINQLRILGNGNAELITTQNKGYRSNGMRHPHSFSIVDSEECVKWIEKWLE